MKEEYKEIYRSGNEDHQQVFSVDNVNGVVKIETIYHPKFEIDKKITFITVMDLMAVEQAMEDMKHENKGTQRLHT